MLEKLPFVQNIPVVKNKFNNNFGEYKKHLNIKSKVETHHNSFMENITNYSQQLHRSKQISKSELIQIQNSLSDHNVKDLLWLSAKMLAVEKPLDFVQSGFVGKAIANGSGLATWGVTEAIKSAALMGVIANDKKYTGSKALLYPLAFAPGIGSLAPFGVLYKDHRALFRLVRGYIFNRQQNYEKKSSAKIKLPTETSNSIKQNTSSKVVASIIPSDSRSSSSTHNKPATIIQLPTKTTPNSANYSQFKLAANY